MADDFRFYETTPSPQFYESVGLPPDFGGGISPSVDFPDSGALTDVVRYQNPDAFDATGPVADSPFFPDLSFSDPLPFPSAAPAAPRMTPQQILNQFTTFDAEKNKAYWDPSVPGFNELPNDQKLETQRMYGIGTREKSSGGIFEQEWAWAAGLQFAALFYQMYADRENRKMQMDLYNQQLKLRKQERDEDYARQVDMAKLNSQLAVSAKQANQGGAIVRGGFKDY